MARPGGGTAKPLAVGSRSTKLRGQMVARCVSHEGFTSEFTRRALPLEVCKAERTQKELERVVGFFAVPPKRPLPLQEEEEVAEGVAEDSVGSAAKPPAAAGSPSKHEHLAPIAALRAAAFTVQAVAWLSPLGSEFELGLDNDWAAGAMLPVVNSVPAEASSRRGSVVATAAAAAPAAGRGSLKGAAKQLGETPARPETAATAATAQRRATRPISPLELAQAVLPSPLARPPPLFKRRRALVETHYEYFSRKLPGASHAPRRLEMQRQSRAIRLVALGLTLGPAAAPGPETPSSSKASSARPETLQGSPRAASGPRAPGAHRGAKADA